jgi:Mce-associated membrane protein
VSRGTARLRFSAGSIGFLLALLLLIAASVVLWRFEAGQRHDAEASAAEDQAALDAARTQTMAWANVDYHKVDDYISNVENGSTGEFLQQFQKSEKGTRYLIKLNRSVQVPTIPQDGVGLVEREGDTAKVLIAMDATVSNKNTKKPQPRQYRLQVTETKVNGEWKTSGLEFIDAQV